MHEGLDVFAPTRQFELGRFELGPPRGCSERKVSINPPEWPQSRSRSRSCFKLAGLSIEHSIAGLCHVLDLNR